MTINVLRGHNDHTQPIYRTLKAAAAKKIYVAMMTPRSDP